MGKQTSEHWEQESLEPCHANMGHKHYRLRLKLKASELDDTKRERPWPPSWAARREAQARGYGDFLNTRDAAWAISSSEVSCLNKAYYETHGYEKEPDVAAWKDKPIYAERLKEGRKNEA